MAAAPEKEPGKSPACPQGGMGLSQALKLTHRDGVAPICPDSSFHMRGDTYRTVVWGRGSEVRVCRSRSNWLLLIIMGFSTTELNSKGMVTGKGWGLIVEGPQ